MKTTVFASYAPKDVQPLNINASSDVDVRISCTMHITFRIHTRQRNAFGQLEFHF